MARRILDANEIFSGKEPKIQGEITQSELMGSLSWYSKNRNKKDALKYASDFIKKKHKIDASSVLKSQTSTFGFLCRIVANGAVLSEKDQQKFESDIEEIKRKASLKKEEVLVVDDKPKTPNIQDRIHDKASNLIGELEGQVDDILISKFSNIPQPYTVMHTNGAKGVHVRFIVDWAKKRRAEFDEVINTTDKDLKEGYSNFNKTQLKKMVNYFDQVILDCGKVNETATIGRKPRKRKEKTPEQLVAKMQNCKEYKDLNLVSVKPTDIIGALQLWVYNTKQRKLGCYHAEDAGGFSVKGTSITNFNEAKSIQKRLRKPEITLPEVLKGGKVALRNLLDGIRAVETPLTGRINSDTILVRLIK